jgi:biotin carboxyl carrier protein
MATQINAPMTGKIADILVEVGDKVKIDDELIIMDAMKMEIPIVSPVDGTVKEIFVKVGDSVTTGQLLMTLE